MLEGILLSWLLISIIGGLFQLVWLDDWLNLNIKVKHLMVGILFLPMTLFSLIIFLLLYLICFLIDSKIGAKIGEFLNKDIMK